MINDLCYVWEVRLDLKVIFIMGHCASELEDLIHFLWNSVGVNFWIIRPMISIQILGYRETDSTMNVTFSKCVKTCNIRWYQSPSTSYGNMRWCSKTYFCLYFFALFMFYVYFWTPVFVVVIVTIDGFGSWISLNVVLHCFHLDFLFSKTWQEISSQAFMFWQPGR